MPRAWHMLSMWTANGTVELLSQLLQTLCTFKVAGTSFSDICGLLGSGIMTVSLPVNDTAPMPSRLIAGGYKAATCCADWHAFRWWSISRGIWRTHT
jgi:hypothetical protein